MYFLIYALGAFALTITTLRAGGVGFGTSSFWGVLFGIIFGFLGWGIMPTLGWNYLGNWMLLTLIGIFLFMISVGAKSAGRQGSLLAASLPLMVGLFVIGPVNFIASSGVTRGADYHALLGTPTESEFTTDVAPVPTSQLRQVDHDLALALGSKRIEEDAGLGSRVDLTEMSIQMIHGCFATKDGNSNPRELCFENELVWVGVLEHSGFMKWWGNHTTPGYVIVSAINPQEIHLVTAIGNSGAEAQPLGIRYFPTGKGGYFGDRLERHLRLAGYTGGLTDHSFEIDNAGIPYWVTTTYSNTIGFDGPDAIGVVTTNAQTGEIVSYDIASAPSWIDRIQPEEFVTTQLDDWGAYGAGWVNAWFTKAGVIQTTPGMSIVYGEDGHSYWYTGMQSTGSDGGTNSFVLINTRTKEVRRYMVAGASETSAQVSAENAPGVREANYYATFPILYNIGGEPTYFMLIKGSGGLVQKFALVNMGHYEVIGIGRTLTEALQAYQSALIRSGQSTNIDDVVGAAEVTGIVMRTVHINGTVYVTLQGGTMEFYGASDSNPELKWAITGDQATIQYQEGAGKSQPILGFDLEAMNLN